MDISPLAFGALLAATMAGAAVQAATGFGFAIVAAPVFLAAIDAPEAVTILAGLHVIHSAILVPRLIEQVPWGRFRPLLLGALVGCPLGLLAFQAMDVADLKLAVGLVILFALGLQLAQRSDSARGLLVKGAARAPSAGGEWVAGGVSGALNAVLVMPGPPLMLHLLRWPMPPAEARALSLTFFAVCYVGVFALHLIVRGLGAVAWQTIGWLVPAAVLGTLVGARLSPLLPPMLFRPLLIVLLVCSAAGAIGSAL